MLIDIYLERYIQELDNVAEKAMIPNITSYQLQLKEKLQIITKHLLIPLNSIVLLKIDVDSI